MTRKNFFNPFVKTAGGKALLWGVAGLAVSAAAAYFSRWHAHGLLHFGPAPRDAAWISALEYLIIWLVPAAIFYGMGSALSRSRIRPVDIFGTTAFALLPLVVANLAQLLPGIRESLVAFEDAANSAIAGGTGIAGSDPEQLSLLITETMIRPAFILNVVISMVVVALMVIRLFNAVKIACNLKGGRLWAVYLIGLIGGDIICRQLIRLMY